MSYVVFDIDGTLTDTSAVDAECFVAALEGALGGPLERSAFSFTEMTDSAIVREVWANRGRGPLSAAAEERLVESFMQLLEAAWRSTPDRFSAVAGAAAALEAIRMRGWTPAIATGGWRPSAAFKLDVAGLPVAGIAMATASERIRRRDIIELALMEAGATARSRAVYVGDGVWDARAATELGIPMIGVDTAGRADALREAGARAVMTDLADTAEVLGRIEEALAGAGRVPSKRNGGRR